MGLIHTTGEPWMGRAHSIVVSLPPLAGIILSPENPCAAILKDEAGDEP